ncbi:formyltransferase family protein [Candidatus Pelagibacter bacterium]|jgi:methionyl-tRNA formyltransferase|nr:formyltransferase family protein [Candidatus Pelagibacter bacterium]
MKIAIFFNSYRGLSVLNHLIKKKKYLIDVYLSKKNLNLSILKKIRKKYLIIKKLNLKIISTIKKNKYDLLIVAGWPLIFSQELIKAAKYETINLHAGRLPSYRGGSPLNWQIIEGKKNIYISIIKMTQKIDGGPVYITKKILLNTKENIRHLHNKVNKIFPYMVENTIQKIIKKIKPKKQNIKFKRYLKQRSDKDGKIKWSEMTDYQVFNLVRAITSPYPGAFYIYKRKKIRLHSCKISKLKTFIKPGKFLIRSKQKFVGCKKGCIQIIKERADK